MQPTRLCRAVMLLGGAFIISAWIFDDPSFYFAGGSVWLFLLLSLHSTVSAAQTAANSLKGERQTKERFSRSGTRINMTATLTCLVPPGYSLEAEEILPDSAADIIGETTAAIPNESGTCTLQYSFRLLAHGTIHHGGVILHCSDRFFTITVPVLKSPLQDPALFVFPEKGMAYEGSGSYGDQETMRRTALKSTGIRSFREYRQGDSFKNIDWKMTARYGTTYVREYFSSEGGTAALFIDLPDNTGASTEEIFSGVRRTVIQRIAEIQERHESSQIVVVAGCEIVAMQDIVPGVDFLRELSGILAPKKRVQSLYRTYSPVMLALEMRNAGERMPLTNVAQKAAGTFGRSKKSIEFEETMYRALVSSRDAEIHCYTTGTGDLSHIWAMASAAYALHRPVKIFLPENSFREDIRKEAEFFNVRSVEVIYDDS